jgi:hypothetical protein
MRLSGPTTLVAVAMALSAACGGPPPAEQQGAATSAAKASAGGVAAGDFGVPECDDYFRKYLACIDDKVPEAARASVRQSVEQTRQQWQRAAETPEGKAALVSGCTQATAAAKQSMSAYGCQW